MERIELETAINELVAKIKPQEKTIKLPLGECLHYHLATDILAPINVPSFNRSAMDGYALKSNQTLGATKKTPVKLKVLTQLLAGDFQEGEILGDVAIRIMTGAHIPDGFDAVIRQEDTNYGEDEVEIYTEIKPYMNYGKIGEDIKEGQLILKRFTRLTPIHLGILASLGFDRVEVLQPLNIGIISSGSELGEVGQTLDQGQIYDSNRYVLMAKLQELNVNVVFSAQIQDNINEVAITIKDSIKDVDMLLTTGGVSVGKKDIMHDVIKELGAKRLFWRVNMRPGTPVLASVYQDKPILSLSGNPFAAITTFELLFRPMLCTFLKEDSYMCKRVKATLMNDFLKESKQRRFVRAYYEEGQVFLSTSEHASSVLSSMIGCNCLIDIKANAPALTKGEEIDVVLIPSRG